MDDRSAEQAKWCLGTAKEPDTSDDQRSGQQEARDRTQDTQQAASAPCGVSKDRSGLCGVISTRLDRPARALRLHHEASVGESSTRHVENGGGITALVAAPDIERPATVAGQVGEPDEVV